jgi:hypothetical protein
LQQAGLTVRDLDGVIMVGGSTRLPTIRETVKDYFQREPEVEINPDEVVAVGAAIHADSLVSTNQATCLLDVTPLSLRIGITGGMAETIIERNSPVPIDHSRIFTTARDDQESVSVQIYQGESREAKDNTLLGQFEFSGYEPGPRGQVQIEVTFAISTEGIVHVSARDPKTGAGHSTTVSMSSGLSEEEIQEILEKARSQHVPSQGAAQTPAPPRGEASEADYLELPPLQSEAGIESVEDGAGAELFGAIEGDLGTELDGRPSGEEDGSLALDTSSSTASHEEPEPNANELLFEAQENKLEPPAIETSDEELASPEDEPVLGVDLEK